MYMDNFIYEKENIHIQTRRREWSFCEESESFVMLESRPNRNDSWLTNYNQSSSWNGRGRTTRRWRLVETIPNRHSCARYLKISESRRLAMARILSPQGELPEGIRPDMTLKSPLFSMAH